MEKPKKPSVEEYINEFYNFPDGAIYMDYNLSDGPIWQKVPAHIGKERYFIYSFLEKGLFKELESRVNVALHSIRILMREILLEIQDDIDDLMKDSFRETYKVAHDFRLEIEEFARTNKLSLNDTKTNVEITNLYNTLDSKLGLRTPLLEYKLSKAAIEIRDEVERNKNPIEHKSFKELFRDQRRYTSLIDKLEMEDYINISNGKIQWIKEPTSKRQLVMLFLFLLKENFLLDEVIDLSQKIKAEILSETFNIKISEANFSQAIKQRGNHDYYYGQFEENLYPKS